VQLRTLTAYVSVTRCRLLRALLSSRLFSLLPSPSLSLSHSLTPSSSLAPPLSFASLCSVLICYQIALCGPFSHRFKSAGFWEYFDDFALTFGATMTVQKEKKQSKKFIAHLWKTNEDLFDEISEVSVPASSLNSICSSLCHCVSSENVDHSIHGLRSLYELFEGSEG